MKRLKWLAVSVFCLVVVAWAKTYTVTKGSNPGVGSLFDAITSANSHLGPDTIVFDISAANPPPFFITMNFPMPSLKDNGTFINGFSQPGSSPNTGGYGEPDNAVFGIIIDGTYIDASIYPLHVCSDSNAIAGILFANIKGMDLDSAGGAIVIDSTAAYNHIWGCRFGLDTTGLKDWGSYQVGVLIRNGAKFNLIGGTNPEERNVFAGNEVAQIAIKDKGTDNNQIVGNYIGTDISGAKVPVNVSARGYGIWIHSSFPYEIGPKGTLIGGPDSTYGNVIAGNPQDGIFEWGMDVGSGKIAFNRIGIGATDLKLANQASGIKLDKNTKGDSILYNRISYNASDGVLANDTNSNSHILMHNVITENGNDGVRLFGLVQHYKVAECEIARNKGNGIYVAGPASDFNTFSRNLIYDNTKLGIDLAPPGVTPNDGNDSDADANDNMNFPDIDSASTARVYGRLQGEARRNAVIEIFLADHDPSKYGEGKTFVGSAVTDSFGRFEATISGAVVGDSVTATATDVKGNTSEFSKRQRVSKQGPGVKEEPSSSPLLLKPRILLNEVRFYYSLPKGSDVRLSVYDASGALVEKLAGGWQPAGEHKLSWNTSLISSGVYFVRLEAQGRSITSKITLIR